MSQLTALFDKGGASSGGNHDSIVARIGQLGQKYTDPLSWAFGKKYTDKLVDIGDFSNKQFSSAVKPFAKVDKTLNPLRRIGAFNKVADWTEQKPADTAAIIAGAYYGGTALGNSFGSGESGGSNGFNTQGMQLPQQQEHRDPKDSYLQKIMDEEAARRATFMRNQIAGYV